jgi:ketosteroid isomerase-like protein
VRGCDHVKVRVVLSPTDRLDIADLVIRADSLATRRDADAYAALFTSDAVLDGAEGVHEGSEQLRNDVVPIWKGEGEVSLHLTLNVEVHEVQGNLNGATANSVLVILAGDGATAIRSVSLIEQEFVRDDETWKISRRTVKPVTPA